MPNPERQYNEALEEFVRARNSTRSAERAAIGFTSGMRMYNLKAAKEYELKCLRKLADWVEAEARKVLGLPERKE